MPGCSHLALCIGQLLEVLLKLLVRFGLGSLECARRRREHGTGQWIFFVRSFLARIVVRSGVPLEWRRRRAIFFPCRRQ
jgi:hypothetical protein